MAPQLTLYGSIASHYAEKVQLFEVELALKEGNISHKYLPIDLFNKPAFFVEQINPVGKVPAITYGGPDVAPEEPSLLSTKLAESDVILEFLADAYPEAKLMPTDPVQRAKVRFFMDAVTRKYIPAYMAWILGKGRRTDEHLLKTIGFLQSLLPETGEYAVGNCYTIADACITPFIHRLWLTIENDIGRFPAGSGLKLGESLKDPKYAKFMAYASGVTARPVAKKIYEPKNEAVKKVWIKLFARESTLQTSFNRVRARM